MVLIGPPADWQLERAKADKRGADPTHHCSRLHLHIPVVELHTQVIVTLQAYKYFLRDVAPSGLGIRCREKQKAHDTNG